MRSLIDRRILNNFDYPLLAAGVILPILGLIVLYSAGYDANRPVSLFGFLPQQVYSATFAKQLSYFCAGIVAMFIAAVISPAWLQRWAYAAYGACVFLLLLVMVVGVTSNGSTRWLDMGGFYLQPSEPMKIGLILVLARILSNKTSLDGSLGLKELILPGFAIAIPFLLIFEQPDLGTALTHAAVGLAMLLLFGIRLRLILIGLIIIALAAAPFWETLRPYQKQRVWTLIDPGADPKGTGYHVIQSKIAVGSGQLTGKGYLRGTQSQLEFLPEHTTDFVFSVLSEEWGFIGSMTVVVLYLFLILAILRVVKRTRDSFQSFVCFGIASLFFAHASINMGMVVGILPVVGITLPLFSYGGSSIMTFMFCTGLVLGVSLRRWFFVGGQ